MAGKILVPIIITCLIPNIQSLPKERLCGCLFSDQDGMKADCENRHDIDFKCLSRQPINSLDLSHNGFLKWPEELISRIWENILYLDLSFNNISYLSSCIYNAMPLLISVNLTYNSIKKMSCDACVTPFIDLDHNNLTDWQTYCSTCNANLIKRLNEQSNLAELESSDCILNTSDEPKPLTSQDQKKTDQKYIKLIFSIGIIFLILFAIGNLMIMNNKLM
ncbi:uncharacterized protein LOC120453133 [Drosophila santomea]|uniref:uncharacterized protein LOC120453133 n=1 Tax=Drosophila santomea TaxID=129105 RepID=UPI001954DC16|nr:uncharacterized protein LOC120453133 [Drosophila santomea]